MLFYFFKKKYLTFIYFSFRTLIIARQVSGIMTPRRCGDIPDENFRSSNVLPVAKNLRVTTNLCSAVIAFLITVFFFWMRGPT